MFGNIGILLAVFVTIPPVTVLSTCLRRDDTPNIQQLEVFSIPEKTFRIIEGIGRKYKAVGHCLLDDKDGNQVVIIDDNNPRIEGKLDDIFKQWIAGKGQVYGGKKTNTWSGLVDCLKAAQLLTLADKIESVYCNEDNKPDHGHFTEQEEQKRETLQSNEEDDHTLGKNQDQNMDIKKDHEDSSKLEKRNTQECHEATSACKEDQTTPPTPRTNTQNLDAAQGKQNDYPNSEMMQIIKLGTGVSILCILILSYAYRILCSKNRRLNTYDYVIIVLCLGVGFALVIGPKDFKDIWPDLKPSFKLNDNKV